MKLVAYVRTGAAEALADPLAYVDGALQPDAQQRAIARWASKHRARIVEVIGESGPADDAVEERVGFARALELVADHVVAGVVVAQLDRLSSDVIVQELLRAHIARIGGVVFTAAASEEALLTDPCPDAHRALIREVIARAPLVEGALRSVRALYRRGITPLPEDREGALLADLDATPFVRVAENVVRSELPPSMRRKR